MGKENDNRESEEIKHALPPPAASTADSYTITGGLSIGCLWKVKSPVSEGEVVKRLSVEIKISST